MYNHIELKSDILRRRKKTHGTNLTKQIRHSFFSFLEKKKQYPKNMLSQGDLNLHFTW